MKLVKELRRTLESRKLPVEVVTLYLYGSFLTSKLGKDSDIGVAVLLSPFYG